MDHLLIWQKIRDGQVENDENCFLNPSLPFIIRGPDDKKKGVL